MIKFATIGTNFITDRFLQAGLLCPDFKLEAVYSRTKARAKEYASNYHISKCYDDLAALGEDPAIDAVYIASPTNCHAAQAIQLLNAGKHVLCEKPIASNQKEAQAMFAAAAQNGVVLLEAIRSTFTPGFKAIEEHLPKLGKIRRVTFSFCQYSSRYDKFKSGIIENAFNPSFSNGAIMDIGVYCIHSLVKLFGLPESLSASAILLSNGIDGEGTIVARYKDFLAELIYSKITDSYNFSEIQGEDASMLIDKISLPQNIKIIYRSGSEETLPVESQNDEMRYEITEFIDLINSVDFHRYNQNSLQTLTLMDEARRLMGIRFPADEI